LVKEMVQADPVEKKKINEHQQNGGFVVTQNSE
jgi:hypothetical protein